jgi:hypothetical protein
MRRFRHGVLSKTSLGLSKDQEVTSNVEHPFVARHLGDTVGLGNKRCGNTDVSSCFFRLTFAEERLRPQVSSGDICFK